MKENNQVQGVYREKALTWGVVFAVVVLLILSLGGMLYAFLVPVQ